MVALSDVQASNSLISKLPPGLVAVFVGATAGIGEVTLKKFAQYSIRPRVYFVGRSQDAGIRIAAECKDLNPAGQYMFVRADVSLIRVVDEVCEKIKTKEKEINILFLSAGAAILDRSESSEKLQLLASLTFYSRIRFMINLLPLIRYASGLRRVVTVAGGGKEGPIDPTDFPASRIPLTSIRGHLTTLISLGVEILAKSAPEVSFIHDYPGTVDTSLFTHAKGIRGLMMRTYIYLFGYWVCVPLQECGERQLYLATSSRFPPCTDDSDGSSGVPRGESVPVARGTTGEIGSGVYSIGWDGESASLATLEALARFRDKGLGEKIWLHTESEFKRITG